MLVGSLRCETLYNFCQNVLLGVGGLRQERGDAREMLLRDDGGGPQFFGHADRKHTHLRKRSAAAAAMAISR